MLQSMPPHQLVMATGPEGGAYYEVGQRYREVLARAGVDVKLVPTAGSVETLDRLRDPRSGVNVGLMQGGIAGAGSKSGLESLGTLFYEPLWWFRRREIDVAFMMTAWDSPVVRQLLSDDRIGLSSFPRADAFVALYPYLNKVVVPRGVADLAKDQPPSDVVLVATKASLIVREDLHSAIQYLLLNAAVELHSGASIFNRANEFPAAEAIDIPLSSEALRFYKSGSPFLHEYFPFWVAALIGKLIILLIPILGVLYPMMRSLPRLYDWMMRSKVLRMYGELRLLEDETESARRSGSDTRDMIARLDRLEQQANHLRVPV